MKVKGVLWHSTGANNPYLKRYVQPDDNAPDKQQLLKTIGVNKYQNDMNHIDRDMGMNCWIGKLEDETVTTIQTLPWDMRPWGCGSGPKGSCNNGWIQFEICEDSLTDEKYFNQVYKEACEITAYLCEMFNIDPRGTVIMNGVEIPTILCHKDSNNLGFGGNHGDIYHWFPKFGKNMETVRNDVAALLSKTTISVKPVVAQMYRIRLSWNDVKSQKGAYRSLESAILACDNLDGDYKVFDGQGNIIHQKKTVVESKYKIGDMVSLTENVEFVYGKIAFNKLAVNKFYIRKILKNNIYIISLNKKGILTGAVQEKYLIPYVEEFKPYVMIVTASLLNVRKEPDANAPIVAKIKKNEAYTIIEEKNGWGKLKSGIGWVKLEYV